MTTWKHLPNWLTGNPLVWRTLDAVLRNQGRHHLAQLDQRSSSRIQTRTLLRLVHRAASTPFGLAHDFQRVRTVADYHRLVPVRTIAELRAAQTQVAANGQDAATAPGPNPALAASFRDALRTGLALTTHCLPRARLLSGLLLVADDNPVRPGKPSTVLDQVPSLVRPYAHTATGPDRHGNDDPIGALAEQHARDNVTCLVGPAHLLVSLIDRVKRIRAQDQLERVWPHLTAAVCTQDALGAIPDRLHQELGGRALVLEMLFRPEGPIALVDPRHGEWRLLTDHGVFFEFLPVDEAGSPRQRRLILDEVEPGVEYEVAVTSPLGLWATRTGLKVTFRSGRSPHLLTGLHVPEGAPDLGPAVRSESEWVRNGALLPSPLPSPVGHRQSVGSLAGRPESSFRSPW